MSNAPKTCFVVMPISDMDGYDSGHFARVYEHLIRPACIAAGLEPIRGDGVKGTNYIAIDILQRVIQCDLVVCDLSGKNANVLYELGVRQAFDLPVVLIKDKKTDRIFDIQGLRTLDYTESLRIDSVEHDCKSLTEAITATLKMESHEVNSLVSLLGIQKATLGKPTQVSAETALVLSSLKDISTRLTAVEDISRGRSKPSRAEFYANAVRKHGEKLSTSDGREIVAGEDVYDTTANDTTSIGTVVGWSNDALFVQPKIGPSYRISFDDPKIRNLNAIPF